MSFSPPPGAYGSGDPLFLLLAALAIEAYLGGRLPRLPWLPHPRRALARAVAFLAARLNRPERSVAARRTRGAIVTAVLLPLAAAAGWLAMLLTRNYPFAWTLELLLLASLVSQRGTWRLAAELRGALLDDSLQRGRSALAPLAADRLSPAAVEALGHGQLAPAGVAALGRRFADDLVSPVLWYVALGLSGLFVQQTAQVLHRQFATLGPFGGAASRVGRIVAAPGAVLTGLLLAVAAVFVPGGRPLAALRSARRPEVAIGAALPAEDSVARLGRAMALFAVGCLIVAGLVAALALLRLGLR